MINKHIETIAPYTAFSKSDGNGTLRAYLAMENWSTGFSKICYQYMQFGPDGALYVSTSLEHRIFRIAPMNPVDLLEDLVLLVITVNENNDITNSSLEAKLNAALNTLDDLNENNNVAAINTLGNFIKAVENQLDKGDISPEDAQDLIDAAQDIIDLLTNG